MSILVLIKITSSPNLDSNKYSFSPLLVYILYKYSSLLISLFQANDGDVRLFTCEVCWARLWWAAARNITSTNNKLLQSADYWSTL